MGGSGGSGSGGSDQDDESSISSVAPTEDRMLDDFWNRRAMHHLTLQGLPPLDYELFSFWALRYVVPPQRQAAGTMQRLAWLSERNTALRLQHCGEVLEQWISIKRGTSTDGSR